MKVVNQIISGSKVLTNAAADTNQARNELIKGAQRGTRMDLAGVSISKDTAKAITTTTRSGSEEKQLNGNYLILGVNLERKDFVKLKLEPVDGGAAFNAGFTDSSLDGDQIRLLQEAEWGRRKVYLSVNARVNRGVVTSATVVKATVQPQPGEQVTTPERETVKQTL